MKILNKFTASSGLILLLVFFIISVFLVLKYVETERQRDLASWQSRLGMLADLRRSAVENELHMHREMLRELAENPSLQLYLSQHSNTDNKNDLVLVAQQSHVRNLLSATADRFGFNIRQQSSVNLSTTSDYGLAITNQTGALLLATKGFPKDITTISDQIHQSLKSGATSLIDLFKNESGSPVYGYIMPVLPLQGMQPGTRTGAVIVLLDPRQGLYKQLHNTHLDTISDETLLLRKNENSLIYISPSQGDFSLFHQIPITSQLAESISLQQSGGFIIGPDYRGTNVLLTGRTIATTPWLMVQKIDSAEALSESNQHQRFLLTSFLLLTGFICASFIAIWRHSTSKRLKQLTVSLEAQTTILNAISDNIHEIIFLVNDQHQFIFANLSLANIVGIKSVDFSGKNLASVLGPDIANNLEKLNRNTEHTSASCVIPLTIAETTATYHVSRIVLANEPYQNASLFVLHDISELKSTQEKRDRLAQGIIGTLVKAVDLHDPYCVDHSARTREVALCIADELKLTPSRRDALEMAALLANIGKLFLPREILTKMDALSDTENNLLRKHIDFAVDILKQLDFEGPVVEIIAQKNEYLDGSGYPHALSETEILIESRILSVANAFVAMSSARAYREGRPIKEALNILLEQSDQRYDRHVVAALFHIAENKSDWRNWQSATVTPINH